MDSTENNGQVTFNYGQALDMASFGCRDIESENITDTYALHEGTEEQTLDELDRMMTYLYDKRHGFAGFLSFSYAQLTMLHLLGNNRSAAEAVDQMLRGIEAVERYCFTGNYDDSEGKPSGFVNFSCGESAEELEKTVRFAKDTYDAARIFHSKTLSIESAYALGVASIVYHIAVGDVAAASEDCKGMRYVCERLRKRLVELAETVADGSSDTAAFADFGNVEELANG